MYDSRGKRSSRHFGELLTDLRRNCQRIRSGNGPAWPDAGAGSDGALREAEGELEGDSKGRVF